MDAIRVGRGIWKCLHNKITFRQKFPTEIPPIFVEFRQKKGLLFLILIGSGLYLAYMIYVDRRNLIPLFTSSFCDWFCLFIFIFAYSPIYTHTYLYIFTIHMKSSRSVDDDEQDASPSQQQQQQRPHDPRLVRRDVDEQQEEESLSKMTESIVIAFFLALVIKVIMYLYEYMYGNG